MDICVSSNFERFLFHLCGDDGDVLRGWLEDFERTGLFSCFLLMRCVGYQYSVYVCNVCIYIYIYETFAVFRVISFHFTLVWYARFARMDTPVNFAAL